MVGALSRHGAAGEQNERAVGEEAWDERQGKEKSDAISEQI